jgi:hypothetical protein
MKRKKKLPQSRSKSTLDKDNSINALNVGKKENPNELKTWLAHPNLSDRIVGLRGERKPPASAVGIANPLEL